MTFDVKKGALLLKSPQSSWLSVRVSGLGIVMIIIKLTHHDHEDCSPTHGQQWQWSGRQFSSTIHEDPGRLHCKHWWIGLDIMGDIPLKDNKLLERNQAWLLPGLSSRQEYCKYRGKSTKSSIQKQPLSVAVGRWGCKKQGHKTRVRENFNSFSSILILCKGARNQRNVWIYGYFQKFIRTDDWCHERDAYSHWSRL